MAEKNKPEPELYRELMRLRAVEELKLGEIAKRLNIPSREITPKLFTAMKWLMDENRRLSRRAAPIVHKSEIERHILEKFLHLKDVFVVPGGTITHEYEYDALVSRWGTMAAEYLDRCADKAAAAGKELHICMSGGETILEFVNSLPIRPRENVFYYASALIGRSHMAETSHVDAIANATIAWSRSGRIKGGCNYATVTPYDLCGTGKTYEERRGLVIEEVDSLSRLPPIRTYLNNDLIDLDIAIAGLGTLTAPSNKTFGENKFTATNLLRHTARITEDDLAREKIIGEIGYCYFDQDGHGDNDRWRFYLTAGDHDPKLRGVGFYRSMVRRKRDVIVIAGAFKEPAIIAALKGKLFNVWFTNEAAAREILNSDDLKRL